MTERILIINQLPDCPDSRQLRAALIASGVADDAVSILDYWDLPAPVPASVEHFIFVVNDRWQEDASIDNAIATAQHCQILGLWACDAIKRVKPAALSHIPFSDDLVKVSQLC